MTPKDYKEIALKSYSVDSSFKKGPVTHEGQEIMVNGVGGKFSKLKIIHGQDFKRWL